MKDATVECLMSMFDQLPETTLGVWDERTRLTYANRALVERTGRTLKEIVGLTPREIWPQHPDHPTGAMISASLSTGQSFTKIPYRDVLNSGRREHWDVDFFHMERSDGRRMVVVRGVNVTKSVEENRAVERKRDSLFSLLQTIPAACAVLRKEGGDLAYEFSNAVNEEWAGRPLPSGSRVRDAFPEVVEQGLVDMVLPALDGHRVEVSAVPLVVDKPSGQEEMFINMTAQPLLNADGLRVLVFCTDVTAEVRARKDLERVQGELRQAVRARDEYMSIASHELRTPLTSVMLQAEMLTQVPKVPKAVRDGLERIVRQGRRLDDMVGLLLDVSRLTRGDVLISVEKCRIDEAVREAAQKLSAEASQAGSMVTLELETIEGWSDRIRVFQIAVNLISNAIKYGCGLPVDVRLTKVGDGALLTVQDHGLGIEERDVEHIFDQFRRVREDVAPGLGLGLWIVKKLVDKLGGKISVWSAPGDGSTFDVLIPVGGGE